MFQPLGEPNIAINPGERALVNLPTVVSTNYPEGGIEGTGELLSLDPTRIRVPIDIDRPGENLTGELLAEAEYTWSFEEGGTASGRGQPYTPGVDPRTNDDYYVSTTFQTTGIKNVNLDVEWTGEVTVETLAPEPVEPVVVSTSDEVEVRQLQSLLTDS